MDIIKKWLLKRVREELQSASVAIDKGENEHCRDSIEKASILMEEYFNLETCKYSIEDGLKEAYQKGYEEGCKHGADITNTLHLEK